MKTKDIKVNELKNVSKEVKKSIAKRLDIVKNNKIVKK